MQSRRSILHVDGSQVRLAKLTCSYSPVYHNTSIRHECVNIWWWGWGVGAISLKVILLVYTVCYHKMGVEADVELRCRLENDFLSVLRININCNKKSFNRCCCILDNQTA